MRTLLLLLPLLVVTAEDLPLAPLAAVEVSQAEGLTPNGAPIITAKRLWMKAPTVVKLGERAFLRGEGVDRVTVEGSQWTVMLVPLDQVRAIAGVENIQALTAKLGTRSEQIGVEVKR